MKEDLIREQEGRSSFSAKQQKWAEDTCNKLTGMFAGQHPALVLNVLTSLITHFYIEYYKEPSLDHFLEAMAHNYRLRTKPDGMKEN